MSAVVDRLCRRAVARAARRWPADLAEIMRAEWTAELDTLRATPVRQVTFAGSLLLSPAVEAEGDAPPARPSTTAGPALGVTLLAGLLFNLVHIGYHRGDGRPASVLLLVAAAGLMAAGARWSRAAAVPSTVLIGAGLAAFLMAGNQVAVMPFMGWADVLPAVGAWVALTVPVVRIAARLTAAGRRRAAVAVAAGGGLVALELSAVAGSAHAALVLGTGFGTAPGWFPLSLLPGDQVADGLAFHASGILLGNASAMTGPLALCAAFVLTLAVRTPRNLPSVRVTAPARGILAGLAGLAACEVLRRSATTVDDVAARLVDNSAVFGFGFTAHAPGQVAVALLMALLALRLTEAPAVRREG